VQDRGSTSPLLLPSEVLEHPFAQSLLVAVGVLEACAPSGRVAVLGGPFEQQLVRTRRALALGAAREAVTPLEQMLDEDSPVHPRSRIDALLVVAATGHATGNREMPQARLLQAIEASERHSLWAPLLKLGPELRSVLRQFVTGSGRTQAVSIALRDILRDLDGAQSAVVEPLTEREQTVLAFLPTLMTNAEIADELLVSVNTVKSHLKAIYRKLGVESRRGAVLRARQLQFI